MTHTPDIFSLFELNPTFWIDSDLLEARYLTLQTRYHPDRFIKSSAQEKILATEKTMAINEAYRLLKNPLSRAATLLRFLSYTMTSSVSPTLLLEMMSLREQCAELSTDSDQASFIQRIEADLQDAYQIFANQIEQKDVESVNTYHRLSFLSKLLEEALRKKE